ncbi:MAG: response regulator [Planctomycetaceae bacterium]|jgi:DNA-binding response OmpR family regulator|nr:response regulator [Planctomycetaceae bacterium]MBT6154034.1 response regulator [Planctomycetaceae bacterium]MBT6485090.1 response regulator [Planctomycetaceae bacterium]MBT6495903.1 response regulator [Planctomycetaceae bacterium]
MTGTTILVADDSRTIRVQVRQILTTAGFDVVEAGTGQEALEQIEDQHPSLAIVDINMPDVDGYELCQTLQERGAPWKDIPIVLLTSLNSHALELLGDELGAYLRKPVQPEELLEAVKTNVNRPLVSR